jgi:hypothetical protein
MRKLTEYGKNDCRSSSDVTFDEIVKNVFSACSDSASAMKNASRTMKNNSLINRIKARERAQSRRDPFAFTADEIERALGPDHR